MAQPPKVIIINYTIKTDEIQWKSEYFLPLWASWGKR
jgi:hypothetical protein